MKCCICGPVRNCGPFLDKVLQNIEKIGSLFEDYEILIYYDKSTDNSLNKLKEYQAKNPRLKLYINPNLTSPFRTHRLATARNFCLEYVKTKDLNEYPFFIMMDFDDVNCKQVRPEILKKYLCTDDWDGLSFNTTPMYYDIWALSIYPYCFSYNHFKNTHIHNYSTLQSYVDNKLKNLKNGELLSCISSFNGFSIYRTSKFLNTCYDGRVRMDLLPKKYLISHMIAANSRIVFKDFRHIKGKHEDCEHRAFHMKAINNDEAKIMITKDILFF
jgi:glycosyltransferase involved in cell wall biosynthesis